MMAGEIMIYENDRPLATDLGRVQPRLVSLHTDTISQWVMKLQPSGARYRLPGQISQLRERRHRLPVNFLAK
jgi:hypothetical protein